mmetsp:Transcript_27290/g.88175  ORF Transcript_27290/g.88175 Transcript_27290/m.88175 type:complete len:226 (+) Transcript_27290:149-826(+)
MGVPVVPGPRGVRPGNGWEQGRRGLALFRPREQPLCEDDVEAHQGSRCPAFAGDGFPHPFVPRSDEPTRELRRTGESRRRRNGDPRGDGVPGPRGDLLPAPGPRQRQLRSGEFGTTDDRSKKSPRKRLPTSRHTLPGSHAPMGQGTQALRRPLGQRMVQQGPRLVGLYSRRRLEYDVRGEKKIPLSSGPRRPPPRSRPLLRPPRGGHDVFHDAVVVVVLVGGEKP